MKPYTFSRLVRREAYLLNHFYNMLESSAHRVLQQDMPAEQQALLQQALQDEEHSWSKAYKLELMLVDFYHKADLSIEWQRRLADTRYLPAETAAFYREQKEDGPIDKLRALTRRLVSDIHWVQEVQRVKRLYKAMIRRNSVFIFLLSFLFFFLPTLVYGLFNYQFTNLRLYYLFTAASAGLLGAAFSQLVSLNRDMELAQLEQLRAMSKLGYVLARSVVGAGAGLIMFYVLQAGLIEGVVFPDFIQSATQLEALLNDMQQVAALQNNGQLAVSQKAESQLQLGGLARPAHGLSMLIIWCVIAGFSEKLIPNLLVRSSEKAVKKPNKKDA
ncbi:MAG: hypothetical protein KTR20_10575 [Cellvibrionaceae bacterium]|nr:hypothetical protein [Cellvibrionaceae bacterium]